MSFPLFFLVSVFIAPVKPFSVPQGTNEGGGKKKLFLQIFETVSAFIYAVNFRRKKKEKAS